MSTVAPAISGALHALTHLRKVVFFDLNIYYRSWTTSDNERSLHDQRAAQQLLAHVPQLLVVRVGFEQLTKDQAGLREIVSDELEERKSTEWWS